MTFLEALELKHFGQLNRQAVLESANQSAEFSSLWLTHALRSECTTEELAIAIAVNLKWKTHAINVLEKHLTLMNLSSQSIESHQDIVKISADTTELVSNFCPLTQQELLTSLKALSEKKYQKHILSDTKYSANLTIPKPLIDEVLNYCEPKLQDVSLFGSEGKNSKDQSIRNNRHYPTPLPNDSIALALLEYSIAKSANESISFAEPPVILSYQSGQYYKWHYDHIYPHTKEIENHINHFGQRNKTAIFYFNDNFSGGETEFKEPYLSVTPRESKVLVFKNVKENGDRDTSSIHRGNTVNEGEKLVMTLWFRSKAFWLRNGLL